MLQDGYEIGSPGLSGFPQGLGAFVLLTPGIPGAKVGVMGETTNLQPDSTTVGAAESGQPTHPATEMMTECLRLLAATSVGRIVVSVTECDHPVIRAVNYIFDQSAQSVLIRSALGSTLRALLRSAKAAFEIDGTDPAGRVGWSVIIVGVTEEITNPAELRRIEALGLEPWAPGHKGHWIRIRSNVVSGRRIALVADKAPGYRA